MSLWMFIKAFGDICLYFSVISAFPGLFDFGFSWLWPALLGGLAVGMSVFLSANGRPALRLPCLLFSAAVFLLAETLIDALVLVPPVAYAAALVIQNKNHLEYYGFRTLFKGTIMVWCSCYVVLWAVWYLEIALRPEQRSFQIDVPVFCFLTYLLCGVMLLRQLRMGVRGKHTAMNNTQMAAVLGGTGLTVASIIGLERFLQQNAGSVLFYLKQLVLACFAGPFMVLGKILESIRVQNLFEPVKKPIPEGEGYYSGTTRYGEALPPAAEIVEQPVEPEQFPWWLVILILCAMTVVLIALVGTYRKRKDTVQTQEIRGAAEPMKRQSSAGGRGNRYKLRQIYRSFLKQQRGRGVRLHHHYTSQDVLEHISPDTDSTAAAVLREVYLSARYQENRKVTPEQLKTARDALKVIRNGKETTS